ncbi:hypothetical protein K435DRAFT_765644 [Dendrothele bispora CBS 962.96]|uniref:Xylanolytic transcriptional activator regulatory domain-containing protein n=1 Tax=Dendrothele bispora (strain CBS 962.96) TaxID=1314807 RepID=A0A4S8L5A9_DENBC|nr:hypothetical protein K435DRAFT_765644 [Dendrothele bispora CBS 962.96]
MEFWSALPFEFCGPAAIRELPLSLDFPDDAHLWELTNIYFTLHHPYYPLLHKSTFEQALSEGLHRRDQDFGQLVLALCAVASRYTNDSRNIPQSHHSSLGLGWKWLQQINLFKGASVMSPVSLHELQTHCLAICFLQTTSQSDFAWMMNGLSLRLAQQRGLYRRKPDIGKGEPHALENELWKRTFWTLMYHDIFMSSSLGRPVAVSIDDYDTEPLVELEDENPGNLGLGQVSDSSTSPVVFWNCYMSLLEILSFAEQTLSSIRRSELSAKLTDSSSNWNQRAVEEINSALSNWLFSIPNHLKWDLQLENATFFAQSSALHVTYYWIQIRVNRLFIPRKGEGPSPAGLSSIAICANAARSCTNVLNVLQRRNAHFACHFPTAGVLYSSAIIFLFNIFRAKELNLRVDLKEEVSDARRCIGFLRNYERTHSACGRLRDILDTIFGNHPLSRSSNEVKLTDLTVSHPRDDRKDNQDPNSSQQVSNTPYEPRISNPNPEDGSQPASTALPSRSSTNPYFTVDFGMLNPTPTRLEQSSVVNPLNPSPASFHTGSGSNLVSPRPVLHDAPMDIRQDLSLHQPDRDLVPGENYSSWGLNTSLPIQPQGGHVQGIDYSTFHAQDGYNAIQVQSSALQDTFSSRPVIDSTSYMNDSYQGPVPNVNEVFQQVAPSVPFHNQAENWDPSTILELNHLFQWYSGHTA